MNASHPYHRATRRRGVVLILVLGMLGLLALIGVTFATFSTQAQIAARYEAQHVNDLPPEQVFDFGMSALINDNDIPSNAARGHSIKRDMYGNDSRNNHHLDSVLGFPLIVTSCVDPSSQPAGRIAYQITTNIPTNNNALISQAPRLYGAFFNGCLLRLQQWACSNNGYFTPIRQFISPRRMTQTFEIVSDDVSGQWHVFTLTYADVNTTAMNLDGSVNAGDPLAFVQPYPSTPTGADITLGGGEVAVNRFEIDGRYMRGFNGTGLNHPDLATIDNHGITRQYAAFPNFLYNKLLSTASPIPSGYNDANSFVYHMDEDYDAPDNENFFLAMKNADGTVVLPSFHRPGNIIYNPNNAGVENDWLALAHTNAANQRANFARRAKFLRPRKADHPLSGNTFPDLIPDATTGQITYDVDNDGDGVTDSVWIDMGYPVQRDPNGKLFKPLFAFMVLGLNGRIPLNTAGNLQKREVNNLDAPAVADHVSHIGYSVNEINPKYALIPTGGNGPDLPLGGPSGQFYMQILLQGNNTVNPPVEGRFGEVDVIVASGGTVFPRAGRSFNPSSYTGKIDGFDTNFDGLDFVPPFGAGTNPETPRMGQVTADLLDLTGRNLLPSERIRRFLTPIDLSGNGRIMSYDAMPADDFDYGLGADTRGRVSYYLHYRPPGIPNWPSDRPLDPMDPDWPANGVGIIDIAKNRVNVLHGYETFRNPNEPNTRNVMALMPWEAANNVDKGLVVPTFSGNILARDPAVPMDPADETGGVFIGGSLALQNAAQLNLYDLDPFDAPFSAAQQEYLNRKGDIDDSGLDSRLEKLLPDLFVTDANASVKRNLVTATTQWDTNTWAAPVATMGSAFGVPFYDTAQQMPSTATVPSLMQGGRRINLNLPLPVSNDPSEPVRLKYVRDIYQMMKSVLYPLSGPAPTAIELAQLGQFAVNIVDFRDPDATMTRFVNYDLTYRDPRIQSVPVNPDDTTPASVIVEPQSVVLATANPNLSPVIQWGMEYNPIAINEVLGYSFMHKNNGGTREFTPRLFVELINTLTEDHYKTGNGPNADLDLRGWGFIITQDDPSQPQPPVGSNLGRVERPNVVTGQLASDTIRDYFVPLIGTGRGSTATLGVPTPAYKIDAVESNGNIHPYVVANDLVPQAASEENFPPEINTHPKLADELIEQMPLAEKIVPIDENRPTLKSDYYWIHLLRPANPNFADSDWNSGDPNNHNADKVVVDSCRFPFFVNDGYVTNVDDPMRENVIVGTSRIYSVQRLQPYRGGHFVPKADTFGPGFPYGYSEQTYPAQRSEGSGDLRGRYDSVNGGPKPITEEIRHSLNEATPRNREDWSHFVFHDRDFQSVAELLLVPACPPGLFTKKFAERPRPTSYGVRTVGSLKVADGNLPPYESFPAYDDSNPTTQTPITPPAMAWYYKPPYEFTPQIGATADPNKIDPVDLKPRAPTAAQYSISVGNPDLPDPAVFPYLAEGFFYSQAYKPNPANFTVPPPTPAAADLPDVANQGWYKLLEFFEVPSTAMGYIGPVAAGQNADWARRDLRPGLLNLNLITDEEVFFGLLDDPRANSAPLIHWYTSPMQTEFSSTVDAKNTLASNDYNFVDNTKPFGVTGFPRMATAVSATGMPTYSVPMTRGYSIANPYGVGDPMNPPNIETMKMAFADFLKLRDGGSGMIYSPFSTSPYNTIWGDPNATLVALQSRPFRSLANQIVNRGVNLNLDINDTVMRPARLPQFQLLANADPNNPYNHDPSIRHAYKLTSDFLTPRNPPLRMFQIPDAPSTPPDHDLAAVTNGIAPGNPNADADSHMFLSRKNINAAGYINTSLFVNDPIYPSSTENFFLGAKTAPGSPGPPPVPGVKDTRRHPLWRTEMLSKVMNQTTVRTHQYAVWVTVGFFEVTKPGNPQLANQYDPATGLSLAVDQLGKEVGADIGKNVRLRSYYLIDRSKATGFDPYQPGDFRDLITFRRTIE